MFFVFPVRVTFKNMSQKMGSQPSTFGFVQVSFYGFWRCFYFFQASNMQIQVFTQNNSNAIQAQKISEMCDRSKDPATFQPMPYQSVRSRGGGSISPIWQRLFLAVNKNPKKNEPCSWINASKLLVGLGYTFCGFFLM